VKKQWLMTDDSADHTVPRNFVAWNARPPTQSAAAMEAGNIPVYRPPAMDQQPAAPPPVRVPRRATTGKRPTITDSPPHSVTIALDRGAVVSMPPPEPVTTRRTSTRRANKRAKGPVVEKPTPVIRTLLSTTTAQDDDDESDSEDALLGSADRSPHVRFSTPISTQLDELAAADNEASSPPPVPQVLRSTVKPTFEPPKPVVVSDADFVANMTKRSSARPRRIDGVEIMPDRFAAFQSDSAEEFFEANKPPWAPRIAARALNNARKWKTLEIYDNFDLSFNVIAKQ